MTTFRRVAPAPEVRNIVECYWTVDDDSQKIETQKIIPDAFTELVFHFGDPYRIKLGGAWAVQSRSLLAGQIRKHFFLENTGASRILGVKLRPSALTHLFGMAMHKLTDKVVDIQALNSPDLLSLEQALRTPRQGDWHSVCNDFFGKFADRLPANHPVDLAVHEIFAHNGVVNISAVARGLSISERYLELLFRRFIGLSPKFFSRIVRFNYIFQLIRSNNPDWSDVVFRSGFYDQSHFIRNFKAFTGEDPSKYGFDRQNIANFFLKER